jgi:cation:H+ antiporter
MPLFTDVFLLAFGIGLLIVGGESMVRGAAALARQLGVSPLVVGLTVVAFGTSAPELAVNVTAAIRGDGAIAFGNLIGSNLANVGLILAGSALVRKLTVHSTVITREIPMMLVASAAALLMGFDALRMEPISQYDRAEGLLLLLFFGIFLYYTIAETIRKRATDPFLQEVRERKIGSRMKSLGASAGLVAIGILFLALGGQSTVIGAVGLAEVLGAPKSLIGLTVVAVGTSLPELSTSMMAARKGESDIAVGNVIGSNIFNLLFVLGVTSVIQPIPVPPRGYADLVAMFLFGVALMVLSLGRKQITRRDGAVLVVSYLAYITWRAL